MISGGVDDLNNEFLTYFAELESDPATMPKGKRVNGVNSVKTSIKAATDDANWMNIHHSTLIYSFEVIGIFYNLAPAILAAIGSRETDFGHSRWMTSKGWGDLDPTHKVFHGFSIMQIDIRSGPISIEEKKELKNYQLGKGTKVFDPYGIDWIEFAASLIHDNQQKAKRRSPNLSPAIHLATAISFYNCSPNFPRSEGGGPRPPYPKSDESTTGYDYANDTLVRAKYFAENWNAIEKRGAQYNQFPNQQPSKK